ncbi:MAG: hypothetical protein ACKV2Q_34080 [Planctomycetaceae bacterium]
MNELRRHAAPLVDRWQRLARGQRLAMIAVLVACSVGFYFLLSRPAEIWQPIAEGREFSQSELAAIQSAWRQAGLKSFRRNARQLLVPAADMARYTAALPKSQRDDNHSSNDPSSSLARANLFTSHEQFEQIKDNDLRATLRRHLRAIPAIADADVIWAPSKTRSAFGSRSKVKATINVLPREGHDLTPELALSLRTAVAGMIPDLSAEDIVVLDQSTGLTLTGNSEPLIVEQQRRRQHERLARQLESRIAEALTHIPNATVQANLVELPRSTIPHLVAKPTFSSAIVWTTDAPEDFVEFAPLGTTILAEANADRSAMPTDSSRLLAWSVAVQIPQIHFEAHVAQQMLSTGHRTSSVADLCEAEGARLRLIVQNLLPPDATLGELSIVPRADLTTTTPAAVPFSAWPHVVCAALAVLSLTAAARHRRTVNVIPPPDRATEHEPPHAESLDALTLPTRHVEADIVVIAPPTLTRSLTQPLTDLARLQQLDPQPLAEALRHERPQAVAVLLTRFSTRLASACLSQFTPALQTDVIRRLKSLGEVPDELVAEIAHAVCQRMAPLAETTTYEPTNRIAHLLPEAPTQRAFA